MHLWMEIKHLTFDSTLANARRNEGCHSSSAGIVNVMTNESIDEFGMGGSSNKGSHILLQSWGYNHINIEGACLEVMSHLQRRQQIQLSLEAITDILEIASSFSICNFKWIPRHENHMAHTLANYGRSLDTLRAGWILHPCVFLILLQL
ncbi:hypothetical protein L6164_028431 [Bauhinia variegata]|uniref:Uncharacterized protein n=1 Tax=Bauhinia variegata TaxID=167791 RepID=A0ACB9L6H9_BAUVA|nr:hypothetical protein L6164_028431 [Bauhinia variegata]